MFKSLASEKHQIFWLVFHALLGYACTQSKWPIIFWVYFCFLALIFSLFNPTTARFAVLLLLGYLLGFEVLARGAKATPFIPHEMGKYSCVFLFFLGLALGGPIKRPSLYGIFLFLLSVPALLIVEGLNRKAIVFNYFGPLALFLGVMFCSKQILTFTQLKSLLRVMVYSIFSLACFAFFKASEFEKIEYGLTANFEAAGGSITNQVATLFGTAISILGLMYLSNQRLFKYKIIDLGLLAVFAVRGLLTFSRGGMLSAALALVMLIIWPKAKAKWQDSQIKMRNVPFGNLLIAFIMLFGIILAVNAYTNNFLFYRYQGKTERAIKSGFNNSVDMEQWTSGRVTIATSDLNMFLGNPFLGVGIGQSMVVRPKYGGPAKHASHLEFTRLLGEHGFLGLIMAFLIFIYPFLRILDEPNNYIKSVRIVFLVLALSVTFHNAMRTMITPVLFAFSMIKLVPDNFNWQAQIKRTKRRSSKESFANKPVEAAVA